MRGFGRSTAMISFSRLPRALSASRIAKSHARSLYTQPTRTNPCTTSLSPTSSSRPLNLAMSAHSSSASSPASRSISLSYHQRRSGKTRTASGRKLQLVVAESTIEVARTSSGAATPNSSSIFKSQHTSKLLFRGRKKAENSLVILSA